ncbi:MAG: hypothetical protein Fues2KO_04300 [Fuerstiella sp.]
MPVSVPVVVDDVKDIEDFPMSRCEYFTVETIDLPPTWSLRINDDDGTVLPLGISGVICSPIGSTDYFHSPILIDETISAFETEESSAFESEYLWLPNKLLQQSKRRDAVRRGDVFRLSERLFRECLAFRRNQSEQTAFFSAAADSTEEVSFSEEETVAFRQWSELQIENARSQYQQFSEAGRSLSWQEDNREKGTE